MRAHTMGDMTWHESMRAKVNARDAALRLMNRLTAGVVFGAVAGLGLAGYTAAATHPGSTTSSSATSTSSASASTTTSGSASSSTGLQSPSTSVGSTSSSGHTVSGGSS